MRRLADGWFPRVEPGPDLDEARHIIATTAAETGRDPASIGVDGRIRQGAGDSNDLVRTLNGGVTPARPMFVWTPWDPS
jgi:alkanesulfonate monooxygenase SsuD/methylene tetrahydromethanopterin reductase-like flavin-dependent oxidoreductase (luciferase family)